MKKHCIPDHGQHCCTELTYSGRLGGPRRYRCLPVIAWLIDPQADLPVPITVNGETHPEYRDYVHVRSSACAVEESLRLDDAVVCDGAEALDERLKELDDMAAAQRELLEIHIEQYESQRRGWSLNWVYTDGRLGTGRFVTAWETAMVVEVDHGLTQEVKRADIREGSLQWSDPAAHAHVKGQD